MLKPCLLAFVEDKDFRSIIETVVRYSGAEAYFAAEGEQLSQLAKTFAPFMVLVDLSELDAEWIFKHISTIKDMNPKLPIFAFLEPDAPQSAQDRAEHYGCTAVFPKEKLFEQLPGLVTKALSGGF